MPSHQASPVNRENISLQNLPLSRYYHSTEVDSTEITDQLCRCLTVAMPDGFLKYRGTAFVQQSDPLVTYNG